MSPGGAGAHQRTLLAILQRQYVGEKEIATRFDYLIHVTRLHDVIKIHMASLMFTVKLLWSTWDRFRLNVVFYLKKYVFCVSENA